MMRMAGLDQKLLHLEDPDQVILHFLAMEDSRLQVPFNFTLKSQFWENLSLIVQRGNYNYPLHLIKQLKLD